MRLIILFLFILFSTFALKAQRQQDPVAARESYDIGAEALMKKDFNKAFRYFTRSTRFDTSYLEAYRLLGETESQRRNYVEAVSAYDYVLKRNPVFSRLLYYQLGDLYYKMGRADLALYYMKLFRDLQDRPFGEFGLRGERELAEERKVLAKLDNHIRAARITLDSTEFINVTKINNLGAPINSAKYDLFPYFSNDGRSVLFTRRDNSGDEDLIFGKRRDLEDNWNISKVGSFNTNKPEGMISLARDGERVYFTLCRDEETSQGGCDVYAGLLIDGKIQAIEPLDSYVNSATWDSQAGISCDGRKLFFASKRPGGVGGSDIWYCEMQEDGHWSQPKNVGIPVNTPEDEEAPFLSNDGQTLFFSSTGHLGLGDQDIFMSWWDDAQQRWTNAINLGPPVNSPHREIGFHLSPDNRTGYFASNRPGGMGELDIYSFILSEKLSGDPITYVSGYVLDSLTGEPIPDAVVPQNGGPTYRADSRGRFFICAGADEVLEFSAEVSGYEAYRNSFAVPRWDNLYPYRIDLLLTPIQEAKAPPPPPPLPPRADTLKRPAQIITFNNTVLFKFNDATLVEFQQKNLKLFMKNFTQEEIRRIRITGYADDIGESDYNKRLSLARAQSVERFFREQGIKPDLVSVEGLGSITGGTREL
ncbi:MAG: OmpA family protein, partial [Bacteroidota bacterium]